MNVLFLTMTGTGDATRASVPFHIAANGSIEVGQSPTVVLAGDAADLVIDNAYEKVEGVGVPPMRELLQKLKEHEVPVYV